MDESERIQDALLSPVLALIKCRNSIEKEEKTYRVVLLERLAITHAACVGLANSDEKWAQFVAHCREQGLFEAGMERENIPALVAQYVFREDYGYNRAWKFGQVLRRYLSLDIDSVDLPDQVNADGGIEAAVRNAAEARASKKAKDQGPHNDPNQDDNAGDADQDRGPAREEVPGVDEVPHRDEHAARLDLPQAVEVEASEKHLGRLFGLEEGTQAEAVIQAMGSKPDGFKILRFTYVKVRERKND